MKKHLHYLITCLLLATSTNLFAQFDTEFWFAAPYVNPNHDKANQYRFVFAASDQPTTVTIAQPANSAFIPIVRSIPANTTIDVNLTTEGRNQYVNVNLSNVVSNYGFQITATNPVFCYYEVYTGVSPLNTEIFSLKGKNALGTNFMIPMQNYLDNGTYGNIQCKSSFLILATEDGTEISITPTQPLVGGHPAGVTFTQTLNAGQFYSAVAAGYTPVAHPVGSVVTSNKKVTITYADDSMNGTPWGGCADVGGDQIVPVNILGTSYIAVQGFTHYYITQDGSRGPYDRVFILATENNTLLFRGGNYIKTLNRGEVYTYDFTTNPLKDGSAVYFESDKPMYVSQLSGFGCEAGYSILPAVDCRGSNSVSITRSTSEEFFLTLLTKKENIGSFTFYKDNIVVNSVLTDADFKIVPGTGGNWYFAQRLISTTQLPVGGNAKIENSSGVFHLGVVHGTRNSSCRFGYFSDFATYQLHIEALSKTAFCEGDTLELKANSIAGAVYLWTNPNGNIISNDTILLITETNAAQSGIYSLSGMIGDCRIASDSIPVVINPIPKVNFVSEASCHPNPVVFRNKTTNLGKDPVYSWDFGDGSHSNATNPTHNYPAAGSYTAQLQVSSQECADSIENEITIQAGLVSYDTAQICAGDFYDFNGRKLYAAGDYVDNLSSRTGCDSVAHLSLTSTDPHIRINMLTPDFCEEHEAILTLTSNCDHFLWSTREISPDILVTEPGIYTVVGRLENCEAKSQIKIEYCKHYMYVPNAFTATLADGINDYFSLPSLYDTPLKNFEITIHNRFGELVFHSTDKYFQWDGKTRGKLHANTVYSYIIFIQLEGENRQKVTGRVTVL